MSDQDRKIWQDTELGDNEQSLVRRPSPGKVSLTSSLYSDFDQPVDRSASGAPEPGAGTDLEAASSSPGRALPSGLQYLLEGSLSTDLSSVRVHTDTTSERAASSVGALAYTVGQDIHFGSNAYQPGSERGDRLIAHEVAHTVQQRGATMPTRQNALDVSSPGDAHEVEAERFASMFTTNPGLATLVPISRGVVSRAMVHRGVGDWLEEQGRGALNTLGNAADTVTGAVGDLANRGIDAIISGITDVASLLAAIGHVSVSVAQQVIRRIAQTAPGILVSFLELNPAHQLAAYVYRQLPVARIQQMLESIDTAAAARVINALAGAALLASVGPILFLLAPERARQIIRNLDQDVIAPLFRICNEQAKRFVTQILDRYWPVGLGFAVGGNIGATFGYPIAVNADARFNLSRNSRDNFKFDRRGEVDVAADTGVGAGVFIGTGSRSSGRGGGGGGGDGQQRGGIGIGASAGAQAQAGVKMICTQKFQFPVFEDNAFLAMLIAITGNDTGTGMMVGRLLFDAVANVDPMLYNTETKFEAKLFAEGNASAEAGIRTGNQDTIEGGETWNNRTGSANTGTQTWWQRILGLCASVSGHAGVEGGISISFQQDWAEVQDRRNGPNKINIELGIEASAALQILHSIPLLSQYLPQAPQLDGGMGARVILEATGRGEGEPNLHLVRTEFYVKTGDLDSYAGEASETSIGLNSLDPQHFASLEAFLQNINSQVTFTRRFSVGSTLGRKYLRMAGRQGSFNAMLPAQYRTFGFTLEGYLDFKAHISVDQIRRIFTTIYNAARETFTGENAMMRLYQNVLTFFSSGEVPAYIVSAVRDIANTLLEGIEELKLHGQAGLRLAAGGQVSAAAKVRVQGGGHAMITMDYDIKAALGGGAITVDDIDQLLRRAVDTARGYIEMDGTDSSVAPEGGETADAPRDARLGTGSGGEGESDSYVA